MIERLNKRIAASGIASRRKADELIAAGAVAVNGTVVTTLGTQVAETDTITVHGKALTMPDRVTYALYKPRNVVTSRAKQGSTAIITELVPRNPAVYPVGRLDRESEGLILLTNDGALTERLTHPKHAHQKVYEVHGTTDKPGSEVVTQLLKGVKLGDGFTKADHVALQTEKDGILVLVITVHEGRHHLIRRMCAAVGVRVDRLIRTKMSNLSVGSLQPGEYRLLSTTDLDLLS